MGRQPDHTGIDPVMRTDPAMKGNARMPGDDTIHRANRGLDGVNLDLEITGI